MFIRGNQGGLLVRGDASKLQREGKVGAGSKGEGGETGYYKNKGMGSICKKSPNAVRHCWCPEGARNAKQLQREADGPKLSASGGDVDVLLRPGRCSRQWSDTGGPAFFKVKFTGALAW